MMLLDRAPEQTGEGGFKASCFEDGVCVDGAFHLPVPLQGRMYAMHIAIWPTVSKCLRSVQLGGGCMVSVSHATTCVKEHCTPS